MRELLPMATVTNNRIRVVTRARYSEGFGLPWVVVIPLPFKAKQAILKFDMIGEGCDKREVMRLRAAMEPFEFEIKIPDRVINDIGISEVYRILSESKTLEHVEKYNTI